MKTDTIRKAMLSAIACTALAGCGSRASVNISVNPDSTIVVEEVVLLADSDDGTPVDYTQQPYARLVPSDASQMYEENTQHVETIDGTEYTGYYTKTKAMTLDEYKQLASNGGDYAFTPEIQIVKSGIPFVKMAKISSTGALDAITSAGYTLDGSSLKVNISVPGTVLESNQTEIDSKTGAYVWENDDINNMSITFRYLDTSGAFKNVMAAIVLIGFVLVGLEVLNVFTKPEIH